MAATKDRLDAAEGRLDQIEVVLGLQPPKPKSAFRQFREHLWQQIKLHKGTIFSILGITIAIAGWFGSGWFKYHLDHKDDSFNSSVDKLIDKKLDAAGGINTQLRTTSESLIAIKTTLDDLKVFIQDVINHQFESVSRLPTATLQERLPAIQHLVSIAKDEGVKASPKVLGRLTQKLGAASTSAAGFWPVAADLLTYRSETLADLQYLTRPDIPPCTSATHESSPTPEDAIHSLRLDANGNITPKVVPVNSGVYENCVFTLDSTSEATNAPSWIKGEPFTLTFRECHIVYHGGRISLLDMPDSHIRLHFVNCLFEFRFTNPPSPAGQKLTQQLLAQNSVTPVFPIH